MLWNSKQPKWLYSRQNVMTLKTKAVLSGEGDLRLEGKQGEWGWAWNGEGRTDAGALLWIGQVQLLVSVSLWSPGRKRASRSQSLTVALSQPPRDSPQLEWLPLDQDQPPLILAHVVAAKFRRLVTNSRSTVIIHALGVSWAYWKIQTVLQFSFAPRRTLP